MSAWQVGRATITPVVEVESKTSPKFLFRGLDKAGVSAVAERAPWLDGSFVDDGGYLLQRIQCLVIELDGTRIAVDTCVGNDKTRANPGWHNLQLPFLADLAAAGYPAESIDAVICTHLHVDHVGWNTTLVDGQWVPTFPNARYVFAQPELEYWQATSYPEGDDIFGDSVAPVVAAGRADLVPVDHRIDGGIRLDPTPGHTPGHVSVVVESQGQQAVITGDMIHTPVQIAEIGLSSAFDYDQRAAADTRRQFLSRYADGALVIGTHWGGPGAGRIRTDGGQWAVDPVAAVSRNFPPGQSNGGRSMSMPMVDDCLGSAIAEGRLPGVIATVGRSDGTVYEGAFGERRLGDGVPMTLDTVVFLASMTKAITGTVAMQQVEQGRLSLDAPAGEVCPYLGEVQVLDGFAADGEPMLRPPKRPVTLRNLLTHSAGFAYEIWNADYVTYMERTGTPSIFGCLDAGLRMPLLFDPGDRWEYGINIDWVGKMVEAVTGHDLDTVMREDLFEPLGMSSTGFRLTPSRRERLAAIHLRGPEGISPLDFETPQEPEFWMGGGGLYSTATDYLRFTRMILRSGELEGVRVLEAPTVAEMSRDSLGGPCVTALTSVHPFSKDTDFYPGLTMKWGLTFMINTEETAEGRSAGSLAWAGLANSYYWIDPVKDVTGVMCSQLFPFMDDDAISLFRSFERAVYASL